MGSERRIHRRVPFKISIDSIKVRGEYYEVTVSEIKGISQDISIGGIGIITAEPLEIGSSVYFDFFLPNEKDQITVEGKIRWIKKDSLNYTLGIKFKDIKFKDKMRIKAFIEKQNKSKKFQIKHLFSPILKQK